jgi:hypothetical protein
MFDLRLSLGRFAFVCLMLAASTASAAKCENVKFKITNNRAQEVKILKAKYWDTETTKWRTEDFGTWKIASKTTESKTKGLEYVKNQRVRVKIEWKYNTGGSKWSATRTTGEKVISRCSGGQTVAFTLN